MRARWSMTRTWNRDNEQRFIKKLDKKRFGQLQSKLENDVSLGMDTYPITIVEAYELAASWKDTNTGRYADDSNHNQHGGKHAANNVINGVGFVAEGNNNNKGKKHNNNRKKNDGPKACFICGDPNHYQKECLTLQLAKEMIKDSKANDQNGKTIALTFDFTSLCSDVLLDNQSNTHVFKNRHLLTNLRKTEDVLTVKGINGGSLKTNVIGT